MKRHLKKIYGMLIGVVYQVVYWALSYLPVFKLYQPIFGLNKTEGLTRECEDRWDVFSKHFPDTKGAVLDIGCNIGYFSFKSAELGHFAYGVEYDHFNVTSCNAIKSVTNSNNCTFVKQLIDTKFVETMPSFDVVINLSVFHHWVKVYGLEQATEMMKKLAQKCSCMIFETGQSNETGSQWPKILSFMGDKPDAWIAGFLKEVGFTSVEMIGTFPTGLTNVDRYLFIAKK